jgi:integrase
MGYTVRHYGRKRTKKTGKTYKDWYVITSLNGREIETEKANPNTEAAAKKLKFKKQQEVHMQVYVPDHQAITFGEAAVKWLQWFDGTTKGPNRKHSERSYRTRESYIRIHLLPRFGHVKMTELAPLIQDFIDDLKLTLDGGTVNVIYGTIAAICTHARKRLGFPRNVLDGLDIDIPERRSRSVDEVPKFEDVHRLLTYLSGPKPKEERLLDWVQYPVIVGLCALAGLRRGEGAGIDAEHIDLDGFWLKVEQQFTESDKLDLPKYRKKRVLPIDPCLHRILVRYREFLGKWSGPLFLDLNGDRRSAAWFASIIQRLMMRVGLVDDAGKNKYSTHGFRHFAGSAWIEQKVPIDLVSNYLGHASTAFTERVYVHELERKSRHREALHMMATMFPDLAQSVIPVIAQPAALLPSPTDISPPREQSYVVDDVEAGEAIPKVEIPDRAPQWIAYAVRLLQSGGWEAREVAEEMGYRYRNLLWHFNRIGLKPDEIRRDAQKARARHLHKNGLNRSQIAKIVDVDWASANRWTQ